MVCFRFTKHNLSASFSTYCNFNVGLCLACNTNKVCDQECYKGNQVFPPFCHYTLLPMEARYLQISLRLDKQFLAVMIPLSCELILLQGKISCNSNLRSLRHLQSGGTITHPPHLTDKWWLMLVFTSGLTINRRNQRQVTFSAPTCTNGLGALNISPLTLVLQLDLQ